MIYIIIIGIALLLVFFPMARTMFFNPRLTVGYSFRDMFYYFAHRHYNRCPHGTITAYTGLFGSGKTLSAVHKVVSMYRRFNDKKVWCDKRKCFVTQKIKILSNVELIGVPFERFEGLRQIIHYANTVETIDFENGTQTVLLVLGDEMSVQLNSRNFKTNIDPLFLNTLLTCRHYRIALYYTSQRFGQVDALLRQVSATVVNCRKIWRLQGYSVYDAWELENANNPQNIKPLRRGCWFVRQRDYNSYDTMACVGNLTRAVKEGEMLTEQEIISLQAYNPADMNSVARPSRKFLKRNKN